MVRVKSLNKLTLKEMILNYETYSELPKGLAEFPLPLKIKINGNRYSIPEDVNEFTSNIYYGQRIYLTQKEDNDFGLIIRQLTGYYYPIVTKKKWDSDMALLFGAEIINSISEELYPVSIHFTQLIAEMIEREYRLLHRNPSKIELAAGIEKLNVFSDMLSLDFLRDAMKCTVPEVLLTPYKECLVRFMIAKEQSDFNERYYELMKINYEQKSKFAK
jgi:hypothetical protein